MSTSNYELLEQILGAIIFIIGLAFFVFLIASAISNYDKNRSYSVGAITILTLFLCPNIVMFLQPESDYEAIQAVAILLASFGIFASLSVLFYVLLYCFQILVERLFP